ncbi:MAG: hypothetical protein LBL56_06840 [Treponema sp.]|jgi:hypothetical protein|nr:hypothetical protein [Treponema sp.]
MKFLKRSRYVFNLDDKEKETVKGIFSLDGGEVIQAVLDDSIFKNLKCGIVLTDKTIRWNIKGARTELCTGETIVNTAGSGLVHTADLNAASVFVQNSSSGLIIHIIDEARHIRIPLKWFEVDEPLKILFYYYFSKFTADYNPVHDANRGKYAAFLKTRRGRSISLIPLVYDIFNHIVSGLLLAALFLPRVFRGLHFAAAEKVLFFSVLVKLLGILFRYRKSVLMNALLIVAASCFLILPDIFPRVEMLYLCLGYAVFSVLFSIFDFDRIFKYLIIVLAAVSAAALFLQLFWLGPLF